MFEYVKDFLKMNDVEYKENIKLKKFSSVKIGGNARIIIFPRKINELISVVKFLRNINSDYKILGRMSNVLPPDAEYRHIVIKTDRMKKISLNGDILYAESGASMPLISHQMAYLGFSAFERLSGIPGSIGGGIVGNAGAFGKEISDIILDVTVFDCDSNEIFVIPREAMDFGYRTSIFKSKALCVLSANFKMTQANSNDIKKKMAELKQERLKKQPVEFPSLGSVFKRPPDGRYAAKMIDECGLKGSRIGDAQISEKHAGFIVNRGEATASDYLSLVQYAKERVYAEFGTELKLEIEIL